MKRITRSRPSPSMVIASIALIAGLSGSAVAKPVAHLIGGSQIKKNADRTRKFEERQKGKEDDE